MAGDEKVEHLQLVKAKLCVDVHPSRAAQLRIGLKEQLNGLLMRYHEQLKGLVLAYSNEKVITNSAELLPGLFPYLRLKCVATLLLFVPRVGAFLEGVVNRCGADYIGLLVLGVVNVSIGAQQMGEEFQFKPKVLEWVSRTKAKRKIQKGSLIRFQVESVQSEGEFIDLRGSLEAPDTGPIKGPGRQARRTLDDRMGRGIIGEPLPVASDGPPAEVTKKKKKKIKEASMLEDSEGAGRKEKHRKKEGIVNGTKEASDEAEPSRSELANEVPSGKTKKHKDKHRDRQVLENGFELEGGVDEEHASRKADKKRKVKKREQDEDVIVKKKKRTS